MSQNWILLSARAFTWVRKASINPVSQALHVYWQASLYPVRKNQNMKWDHVQCGGRMLINNKKVIRKQLQNITKHGYLLWQKKPTELIFI